MTRSEYDDGGWLERIIVNYVDGVYDPAKPDKDIITRYEYDTPNYRFSTFDLFDRETCTEYDVLGRTERPIANYVDGVFD